MSMERVRDFTMDDIIPMSPDEAQQLAGKVDQLVNSDETTLEVSNATEAEFRDISFKVQTSRIFDAPLVTENSAATTIIVERDSKDKPMLTVVCGEDIETQVFFKAKGKTSSQINNVAASIIACEVGNYVQNILADSDEQTKAQTYKKVEQFFKCGLNLYSEMILSDRLITPEVMYDLLSVVREVSGRIEDLIKADSTSHCISTRMLLMPASTYSAEFIQSITESENDGDKEALTNRSILVARYCRARIDGEYWLLKECVTLDIFTDEVSMIEREYEEVDALDYDLEQPISSLPQIDNPWAEGEDEPASDYIASRTDMFYFRKVVTSAMQAIGLDLDG